MKQFKNPEATEIMAIAELIIPHNTKAVDCPECKILGFEIKHFKNCMEFWLDGMWKGSLDLELYPEERVLPLIHDELVEYYGVI